MLPPAGRPRMEATPYAQTPPSPRADESVSAQSAVPHPVPAVAPRAVPSVPTRRLSAPLTARQQKVSLTDEAAFAAIERELGGRQRLVSILSSAQFPKAESTVVGMIADPENDDVSLAKVCALGGVPLSKLLKMFKEATLARGQLLSLSRIAEKLPDVAAAVMDDAIPGERPCPTCNGLTTVMMSVGGPDAAPTAVPCGNCKGTGLVRFVPDHDVQKTALQLGGLLQKGGNITQIVAQQNNGGGTGSFDDLVGALDKVIYGTGRERFARASGGDDTVDAEILGEEANG